MDELELNEPWHCSSCNAFIYNIDELGRPAPGAPPSRYISAALPKVCNVCWHLYVTISK